MQLTNEQELLKSVVTEAWTNEAFKQKLIEKPVEAIEELTGQKLQLPDGVTKVVVVDQSDSDYVHVNIPPEPNVDNIELTADQLEVVSGGGAEAFSSLKVSICQIPRFTCTPPIKGFPGTIYQPSPTIPTSTS